MQLCIWSIDTWEKRKSVLIQLPAGKAPSGDTRVQFHTDQVRLLVAHETQLAIYDASKMERIRQVNSMPAYFSFSTTSNMWLMDSFCCSGSHKIPFLHLYHVQRTHATVSLFLLPFVMVTLESSTLIP